MTVFSPETTEARKKWHNIFQVQKELQSHNPTPGKNILQEQKENQDIFK